MNRYYLMSHINPTLYTSSDSCPIGTVYLLIDSWPGPRGNAWLQTLLGLNYS